MQQIMDKLVVGKSIQYKITIPEGLTHYADTRPYRRSRKCSNGKVEQDGAGRLTAARHILYIRGTTRQEIVNRMRSAQDKLLAQAGLQRARNFPLATPMKRLILASIVEKETRCASERRRLPVFLSTG